MEEVKELLEKALDEGVLRVTVSNPRRGTEVRKLVFRPFLVGGRLMFQREEFRGNQVFHENSDRETTIERICALLEKDYRQLDLLHEEGTCRVLVSKKGVCNIKGRRQQAVKRIDFSHNRRKHHILDTGEVIPFLVDLGVQTAEGKIVDKKYKKFRQINRFLEFVRDVIPELDRERKLRIIDFGCGKSYLTFAVYYYLKVMNGFEVEMTGLDLKSDVIRHCNELADKYGYEDLHFVEGDISSYEGTDRVDMVITLHACDTATDFALDRAVRWGAGVILSVPCCQHELNGQIQSDLLAPMLKYGIIRERFSALLTDALRAELLEQKGYRVQILEFIDMEHTPKNLLIRAVRTSAASCGGRDDGRTMRRLEEGEPELREPYHRLCDALDAHATLEKLLFRED